jgi:hypothetical protein
MPKTPIDYSKTIIYKIEHIENDNLVYVGHTTCWDKRKCKHKSRCNNEKDKKHNVKVYQMIRENGGWDMFRMIEVEKYSCKDRREAERRENEIMKELKTNMNTNRSYITEEEKKQRINEYSKKYYYNNVDAYSEKHKAYYEKNQEEIKNYAKEYRIENLEKVKFKEKCYRENNIEKIKEKNIRYRKLKINCECGCEVNKTNLNRHQISKKHIDLINKKI